MKEMASTMNFSPIKGDLKIKMSFGIYHTANVTQQQVKE